MVPLMVLGHSRGHSGFVIRGIGGRVPDLGLCQNCPAFGRPVRALRGNIGIRPQNPYRAATEVKPLLSYTKVPATPVERA
jgi:hypothetical protein